MPRDMAVNRYRLLIVYPSVPKNSKNMKNGDARRVIQFILSAPEKLNSNPAYGLPRMPSGNTSIIHIIKANAIHFEFLSLFKNPKTMIRRKSIAIIVVIAFATIHMIKFLK